MGKAEVKGARATAVPESKTESEGLSVARVVIVLAFLARKPLQSRASILLAVSRDGVDTVQGHDRPRPEGGASELGSLLAQLGQEGARKVGRQALHGGHDGADE